MHQRRHYFLLISGQVNGARCSRRMRLVSAPGPGTDKKHTARLTRPLQVDENNKRLHYSFQGIIAGNCKEFQKAPIIASPVRHRVGTCQQPEKSKDAFSSRDKDGIRGRVQRQGAKLRRRGTAGSKRGDARKRCAKGKNSPTVRTLRLRDGRPDD